ncbi:uncharacterized protein YdgA (DUF945 family) [Aeromonas sp. BIGb0405]|uniref:YdgA family protein n=1 Tax=Aeromonas sp. BIGb0405 TaxID=2940592 RepID=UPI0021676356|nr:YdgA family protein [Aeromonas sp. BIGb0405]MCS3455218.1 uncharacterized protein YdgA (DUF945 family) [Aeromonas sp. BIGb0405]
MKKWIWGVAGAALIGAGLGACWYTGSEFDRQLAQQIIKLREQSGIELQWQPSRSNLLHRDGEMRLIIGPEALAQLDDELSHGEPIMLAFKVEGLILPLYVKSHLLLDTEQGSLAPLLASQGLKEWRLELSSLTNLLTQGSQSKLNIAALSLKHEQGKMTFQPLQADYSGDLVGNGHMTLNWAGMSLHETQSGADMVLADLKGSAELRDVDGSWLSPQSDMTLASFSLQQPQDGLRVSLQRLTSHSRLEGEDAQTLSNRYQIQLAALDMANDTDNLALTDAKLDLEVKGLDLAGYQALSAEGNLDQQALLAALDQVLGRGLTLTLTDLSSRLNGEPASLTGELTLASTTLASLAGEEDGMKALSGLFQLNLSEGMGEAVPQLAPMLLQLQQLGYLKVQQSNLKAELKLQEGKLTVNELPL